MNEFLTPQEEKPLNTCKECKTQECIKTGKVCKKIEQYLSKNSKEFGMGYNPRHIRRKEVLMSNDAIEKIAAKRAFELKFGKRKARNFPQDD